MAWSNPKKPYEHVGYCSLSDTPGMAMVTNFKKGDPIIFFLSISFHLFVMDFSQIWASQAGRAKAGFSQVRALDNLLGTEDLREEVLLFAHVDQPDQLGVKSLGPLDPLDPLGRMESTSGSSA